VSINSTANMCQMSSSLISTLNILNHTIDSEMNKIGGMFTPAFVIVCL